MPSKAVRIRFPAKWMCLGMAVMFTTRNSYDRKGLTLFHCGSGSYHSLSLGSKYASKVIFASVNNDSRLSTSGPCTSSPHQSRRLLCACCRDLSTAFEWAESEDGRWVLMGAVLTTNGVGTAAKRGLLPGTSANTIWFVAETACSCRK